MADFSDLTGSIFGEPEEPKKKSSDGPDYSGLSFKETQEEEKPTERVEGLSLADIQPEPEREQDLGTRSNAGRTFPTQADFDTDEEGVLDFIARKGGDIFQQSLVGQLGATEADIGRRRRQQANMEDVFEGAEEDASYLDKLQASFALMNPVTTLTTLFTGNPLSQLEEGKEQEERGTAVRDLAKEDLEETAKEADTTGKQIAFDVISSAAATAPALATAPLGSPALTLTAMGATAYFDTTQEAYENTKDLTRARQAGFIDAFIEAGTEKIPLTTLFNMGKGKSLMKDALKFLIQEEGSELAATALQDLNAKLMYEPDMTWDQALDNLARTALSTPFSAGLQAGGMTAVRKVATEGQKKIDEYIKNKMPAPKTDLSEEVVKTGQFAEAKRQEVEALTKELEGLLREAQVEASQLTPEARESTAQFAERSDNPNEFMSEGRPNSDQAIFNFLRSNNIRPLRNGQPIDPAEMQPGEVLTVETPKVLETAMKNLRDIERSIKQFESGERGSKASPAEQQAWKDFYYDQLENAKKAVVKARKEEQQMARRYSKMQDTVKAWVKKYAPDMKVVLMNEQSPSTAGRAYATDGNAPAIIGINFASATARAQMYGIRRSILKEDLISEPGAELPETLAHEFGHALLINQFSKQPQEIQDAILKDWQNFVQDWQSLTFEQMGSDFQRGHTAQFRKLPFKTPMEAMKDPQQTNFMKNYYPSFVEFLAHRMARAEGFGETTQKFFTAARKTVEKYWNSLPKSQKYDRGFEIFLKKMAKETQLERAKAEYASRVRRYRAALEAQRRAATTPYTAAISDGGNTVVPPTNGGHWNGRDGRTRRVNSSVDKFNWFIRLTAGLTHLTTMNGHIPGVQNYDTYAQTLWQDKMRWTSRAMEVMREILSSKALKGADERKRFNDFLFEADRQSEQLERKLDDEEMAELREQFGISNDMYALAERVWGSFNEALSEVEDAIVQDLQNQLMEGNPAEINEALKEVRRDFAAMRNRNYMPHSRFGTYTVTGYAQEAMTLDDREFQRGQVIFFGSYATEKEALQAKKDLGREYGSGVRFGVGMVEDNVRELLDLPPALAQMLESKLNLDAKQQKDLTELRAMLAPGQSFRKRFVQREGVAGYSEDGLRVYADYMQKFAGHLARIKNVPKMEAAIQLMKESARGIRQQGGNSVKREKLIGWYERHLDYLLNPGNELASFRAIGFLWYLGFNVKSAVVNATQIPMVTQPYLAQEYNDVSAAAAISSAMYQVTKAQFTERGMDQDAARMVEELIERGIIDESLATELAALAEGGFLARAPGAISQKLGLDKPENTLKVQKFFEWGALMFQAVEKMNRRITAVAAYQLSRKAGDSHEVAVNKAHTAVRETQYEYARFNRPEMMRGPIKSNVFMFWQYITNTMWFLGQNRQAAARYMVIMFLLGGLEGIPFAGNALDLLDFGIKKLKEATGWKDPKKGAREYLWELGAMLDDDPLLSNVMNSHTMMNGYSSRMFGMFDLSASVQMGRMLPGTEYLATDLQPKTEILGGMAQMAGATVNIPLSIIQGVFSSDPDHWKRIEGTLPMAGKSVSQMVRYATRGEETDRRGAEIADFNWPSDPKSWAELLGRGAGFQLTRITEEREKRFASYDAIQYYSQRHNSLTKMLNYAYDQGDPDRIREAYDAIAKFNKQVPFGEMMIQTQSLTRSIKEAKRRRAMREFGIAEQKKYIRLQNEVEGRREIGEE